MKARIIVLIGAFVLVFASCNQTVSSKKQNSSEGMRIVSLAPSVTKELIYLGVKDQIVGVTSYCNLAKNNKELVIGTAIDINIEKILLLKPNVVIATGLTKSGNIETLRDNGVKVYQIGKMTSYSDICKEFLAIGKMVRCEEKANQIIAASNVKIDSLQTSIPQSDSLKVFFQIGAKPLFGVIPNTFMDDLIKYAKCQNITYDMNHGTISRETVLNRNPDVIYVATMGIVGDEEKEIWESYSEIKAVKNNKVLVIDSNMACTPSVIAFVETLTQMINEIYE